ncbi:glycosyltransferase family 4 protein [Mesonia aestuariivivens]|uniref:Glycosyltransferase family 4 protein n=1 Tax=Mesonia aestuariivivens TaxID=2796128 RepID=A0ABS6W0K9_9FLAO|nr:glycosyltransferase family 4 protein [Mesonia aestuariivivens]MBW2961385.1 glycosyltransferase family 4 protein [Mesonia aestuariivivens]
MKQKKIYILHKNGANNHYLGLAHLCKTQNIDLKYREFSVASKLLKSITKANRKLFIKQMTNAFFLVHLLLSKNKKIILGIAPYDSKLSRLLWVLNRHQVFYHTSWTCWDKSFQPKKLKKNAHSVLKVWEKFIENKCKHIFTVTNHTKNEILNNYNLDSNKISVVYHSISNEFLKTTIHKKDNQKSFIYVGRITPEKGIEEMINFFSNNPDLSLTIIGNGKLKNQVLDKSTRKKNIEYIEYVSNRTLLASYIEKKTFLILNSHKTKKWEELFGMVLIEAMSQGTIPISTNHSGPNEIIDENLGFLYKEGDLGKKIKEIIKNQPPLAAMSENCINFSKQFTILENAKRWKKILS